MADTIYETIGGRLKIQEAVDLFYQKVLADESLRPFFDEAGIEHLRSRQSMFVSMLLGGRVVYTGKDIHSAHAGAREMGMNQTHFETFLKHFCAALEEVGVAPDRLNEIMKLLEVWRDSVVNP
jgi:truncated hemoglobin YjbI